MITYDCSLAESVTETLPGGKVEENKEFLAQKDKEKAAVDAKQEVAEQPFASDQSESTEQPADTVEEPEPRAETASNTE